MFNSLSVRGFRSFEHLEIKRFGSINLLTGKNNSGKTTLLEALFLLSSGGNPQTALNTIIARGIESASHSASAIPETFWKPIYFSFDMSQCVEIAGLHSSFGQLNLKIALELQNAVEVSLDQPSNKSVMKYSPESGLRFSFSAESGEDFTGLIRRTGKGFQIEQQDVQQLIPVTFLSSRVGDSEDDAIRLALLRKHKQGHLLLNALKLVEPKLESVEDNSSSGAPMIWGDIGLPELMPLPVMGEGMTRIARLILAISSAPHGVVLVDEIDNGFHHTVLTKVWQAIDKAAQQFDTQIVASTHSYECMEAAHRSLESERLVVHRLENTGNAARCITYDSEELSAAVSHNLEVR